MVPLAQFSRKQNQQQTKQLQQNSTGDRLTKDPIDTKFNFLRRITTGDARELGGLALATGQVEPGKGRGKGTGRES